MGVSAEDPALAFRDLVQELVDANLAREPERAMRVSKREAAALVATDADVAVTIQMLPGARRAPVRGSAGRTQRGLQARCGSAADTQPA